MNGWSSRLTSRRRAIAGGVAASVIILMAGFVTWYVWPTSLPDVQNASLQEIAQFMADGRLAEVTSADRQQFVQGLAERYLTLDTNSQQAFDALCKETGVSRQDRRQLHRTLGLTMARQMAHRYQELSSEQREQFLDRLYWFASYSPIFGKDSEQWFSGEKPARSLSKDRGGMRHAMEGYHRLVGSSTSATERAAMIEICRGLSDRWETAQR